MQYLAALTPQELAATLEQGRRYVQIEQQVSERYAKAYAALPRRVSSAPPPMRTPRGAASVPKDKMSLAKRDDATDYIRARQAEMKRAEER